MFEVYVCSVFLFPVRGKHLEMVDGGSQMFLRTRRGREELCTACIYHYHSSPHSAGHDGCILVQNMIFRACVCVYALPFRGPPVVPRKHGGLPAIVGPGT